MPSFLLEIGWFGFGQARSDHPPRRYLMIGPVMIVLSRESLVDRERRINAAFVAQRADLACAQMRERLLMGALDAATKSAPVASLPAPNPSPPGDPVRPGSRGAFLDVSSQTLPPPAPRSRGWRSFSGGGGQPQPQETDG